jgi:multidrug resistance efflux pump
MEEKRQAELIAKKELIKKYQQERAVILEEQKAMEYQSQQLEAERKKRELELNRPKILERELLFKKKMEERKAKEVC